MISASSSWSRLIAVATPSEGASLPCLFLYIHCDVAECSLPTKVSEGVSGEAQVKVEGGAPCSDDSEAFFERALLNQKVFATLFSPSMSTLWKSEATSLEEIRPSYMSNRKSFVRIFESVVKFRSSDTHSTDGALIYVYPMPLTSDTTVARVDVRLSAKGGNASVALCTFHCSLSQSNDGEPRNASVAKLFQSLAADLDSLSSVQQKWAEAERVRRECEERSIHMTTRVLKEETTLLQGFVSVLNQKKAKIRQMASQIEELKAQNRRLVEAVGSDHEEEGEVDVCASDVVLLSHDAHVSGEYSQQRKRARSEEKDITPQRDLSWTQKNGGGSLDELLNL